MKTSLSPTLIQGLALALTLAWTSASLAQTEIQRPITSSSDTSVSQPAVAVAPPATTTLPPATRTPAPKNSSPALLPLGLFPANGPLSPNVIDRDGLPANTRFSYWTTEVIKLARAGIDDDVLLTFIDSVGSFNLSADEIIYLSDIGVSRQIITTMIQHDFEVAAGLRLITASASPSAMLLPFLPKNETAADTRLQPANPPASVAPASATAQPIDRDPVITYRGDILSDLAEFDFGITDPAPPAKVPAPNPSRPADRRTPVHYAVRQPYAEAVTPPIIIVPTLERAPNVVLIRFNP